MRKLAMSGLAMAMVMLLNAGPAEAGLRGRGCGSRGFRGLGHSGGGGLFGSRFGNRSSCGGFSSGQGCGSSHGFGSRLSLGRRHSSCGSQNGSWGRGNRCQGNGYDSSYNSCGGGYGCGGYGSSGSYGCNRGGCGGGVTSDGPYRARSPESDYEAPPAPSDDVPPPPQA